MRLVLGLAAVLTGIGAVSAQPRDPAAWGSDHVGKPVPEFVTGDECLFCHRAGIGSNWQRNAHGTTIRDNEETNPRRALLASSPVSALANEVSHFLGSKSVVRLLRKKGYNQFDLATPVGRLGPDGKATWTGAGKPEWQKDKFQQRCAGCHTTGVDPQTLSWSAPGHDCFVCHGVVDLEHANDTSKIWLAKKKPARPEEVTAICASCHLREVAKSKSTGRPYPNNFVVGDNLFRDYQVDWSKAEDASINPGDRHVIRNVRDVVLNGSDVTCLSCHKVHESSSEKHRRVLTSPACLDCHYETGPKKEVKRYTVRSALCEY